MIRKLKSFPSKLFNFIKKHKRKFIALMLLLAVGIYILFSNRNVTLPETYMIQQIQRGNLIKSTTSSGSISSQKIFNGGFKTQSEVTEVYVKLGDQVKAGQPLMKVDDTQLSITYRQKELALRQAQTARDQKYNFWSTDIEKIEADIALDQARMEFDKAKKDLENAVLRSEIDGTVVQINLEVGDVTSITGSNTKDTLEARNAAAVVVMDTTNLKVNLQISEAEVSDVKVGQKAMITFETPSLTLEGKVSKIDLLSTLQNNVSFYNVAVNFKQDSNEIKVGMIGDVNIILEEKENVLIAPNNAIQFDILGEYVEVQVEEDQFEKRYIKKGISNEVESEITEGVNEGEFVKIYLNTNVFPGIGFGG